MVWLGDLSGSLEDQIIVNLNMVRYITCSEADGGRLRVVLTMGTAQTVELLMQRERYSDFLRLLNVQNVG
ncbi:MAG: hypothetical protein Q8O35_01920 [Humidesulfovibrio sp.]|nr:hypothetical protein [Humidesulfovibrio sp.]